MTLERALSCRFTNALQIIEQAVPCVMQTVLHIHREKIQKEESSSNTFLQALDRGTEEIFSATRNNPCIREFESVSWLVGIIATDPITISALAKDGVNTEDPKS